MINLILRTSRTSTYTYNTVTYKTHHNLLMFRHRPYNIVNDVFDFQVGDLVIVVVAGQGRVQNITEICSGARRLVAVSAVDIKRVFVFTEDLYALRGNTAEEIRFLKKLTQTLRCDHYEYYHCERDVRRLDTQELDIKYFDWFVTSCIQDHDRTFGTGNVSADFEKKICCLNRRFDEHRYLACAVLSNYHSTFVTQQYSLNDTKMHYLNIDELTEPIKIKVNAGFKNLKNKSMLTDRSMKIELVDNFEYFSLPAQRDLNAKTKNAFCSVVTESNFYSDFANFSEKTLRAIQCGRPFLLLAPPGTLRLLQQLGIKTFSEFWDESYDDIQDHTQRFDQVMQIATSILDRDNLSIEPMRHILQHNQHQLMHVPHRMLQLNL